MSSPSLTFGEHTKDLVETEYVNIGKKKYKMCDPELKRICIDQVEIHKNALKDVSENFQVTVKNLKRWLKVGSDRKKGGGCKVKDPEMERKLLGWLTEYQIAQGNHVTSKMFKHKALEFTTNQTFTASKGWLEKIKKRHGLQINKRGIKIKFAN